MKTNKLLRGNGIFLMFMGTGAALSDAVGHFFGRGPLAAAMYRAPLAISSFEAHLLAVVLGVLLWKGARSIDKRPHHVLAAVVHLILGGSNVLFFQGAFGSLGMERFGVVITTIHFLFVVAQAWAAMKLDRFSLSPVVLQKN